MKSAKVKQLLKTMAAPSDEKLTNLLISFVSLNPSRSQGGSNPPGECSLCEHARQASLTKPQSSEPYLILLSVCPGLLLPTGLPPSAFASSFVLCSAVAFSSGFGSRAWLNLHLIFKWFAAFEAALH